MKLHILIEPAYRDSPYCITTQQGLCEAARLKRIPFAEVDRVEPLAADSFLVVIPTNRAWLIQVLADCGRLGVVPVVLNCHTPYLFSGRFSYVNSDVAETMDYLAAHFAQWGVTRPALYAANPDSISDQAKVDQFLACAARHRDHFTADEGDVYRNHGSLQTCGEAFLEQLHRHDCVICTNKFAAIHLWKQLPESARTMRLISYGSNLFIEQNIPGLISVSMCYEDFGRAALAICELLRRENTVQTIGITVKCKIQTEDNAAFSPLPQADTNLPSQPVQTDRFYRDDDVHAMVLAENLLAASDRVDLTILELLQTNLSYRDIAQQCYLSQSALKYRIQKMKAACGCTTREELAALLQRYQVE